MGKVTKEYLIVVAGDKACKELEKYLDAHSKPDAFDESEGVVSYIKYMGLKSKFYHLEDYH